VRNFTIIDAPQRSDAWFAARVGRLTGSVVGEMLAKIQKGEAAGRRNLRLRLVLEQVTGKPQEPSFVSPAMTTGIEREDAAFAAFESLTGNLAVRTGFLAHNTLKAGCSLDGHVGAYEGIIEIKSPQPPAHLEYLKTGTVPGDYLKQILHGLWITGAAWCDWLSYNPDFPEALQVKLVRIPRDEPAIAAYEKAVVLFLADVDRECADLAALGRTVVAA